jgi:putative hydrolase of the HAD superfamily
VSLAKAYRGIFRNRLQLYPGVLDVLNDLRPRYKLAAISDAQSAWCLPEMRAVGIDGYFDPIIVSGDFSYRKPDARLFEAALKALGVGPENVLFVGNNMYRDVYAGKQAARIPVMKPNSDQPQASESKQGTEDDQKSLLLPEIRNWKWEPTHE